MFNIFSEPTDPLTHDIQTFNLPSMVIGLIMLFVTVSASMYRSFSGMNFRTSLRYFFSLSLSILQ